MLKSISLSNYDYNKKLFIFKLIDDKFECDVEVIDAFETLIAYHVHITTGEAIIAIITEYQKRDYTSYDINKNLFKCIICLSDKYECSFDEILNWQYIYLDEYYKDINFNEKYYQNIKGMWDNHKVFM